MYLNAESSYISGLTNMASSCSTMIGPSYVEASCFGLKKYKHEFLQIYEIDEKDLLLKELNVSFNDFLTNIFGDDKKLIDGLMHWIRFVAGETNKIFTIDEHCDVLNKISNVPFYFLEDLFFIECEKMVICFLIGNDE